MLGPIDKERLLGRIMGTLGDVSMKTVCLSNVRRAVSDALDKAGVGSARLRIHPDFALALISALTDVLQDPDRSAKRYTGVGSRELYLTVTRTGEFLDIETGKSTR